MTHLDVSDIFEDLNGKIDHSISDRHVMNDKSALL